MKHVFAKSKKFGFLGRWHLIGNIDLRDCAILADVVFRTLTSPALLLLVCPVVFGATLSIPNRGASPGQTLVTPVMLSGAGQSVAAIQFDLQYDSAVSVQVSPGVAMDQASKLLYSGSPSPGTARYLVAGDNATALSDGVLVNLIVTVSASAAAGTTAKVSLLNAVGASPAGDAVSLQATSANITIQNSGGNGTVSASTVAGASVLNGASLLSGPIAPGEIVSIFGSLPSGIRSVLFNGAPSTLLYNGAGQINTVVPFGVSLDGPVDLQLRNASQTLAEGSLPVAPAAPAIFAQTGNGAGQGVILNQDYTANSASNPAIPGSVVMLFGTGFGVLASTVIDGQVVSSAVPLASAVSATIGGIPAECLYSGAAPTLIAGVVQINLRVPVGLPTNAAAAVSLRVGSIDSAPGITVSVR